MLLGFESRQLSLDDENPNFEIDNFENFVVFDFFFLFIGKFLHFNFH
jgi:hypothetical protein